MGQRVLVADDSAIMRKLIIRCLNAIGIEDIVEASDGAEALDRFGNGTFDCVLTDWNMPNKSGLDVLKGIRESGSDVPVIMITTESDKGHVLEAIQAGVTDYLKKPFETEALREKLDKLALV